MTNLTTPTPFTTNSAASQPMIAGTRLLMLAPDTEALRPVTDHLAVDAVDVISAPSADAARARLHGQPPAAVLLSADADGSAYGMLEELRTSGVVHAATPAIAVSPNAEPLDRVRALQRGCVDFLGLPLFYPELALRLALALSRNPSSQGPIAVPGGLVIDPRTQQVTVHGQLVYLTDSQFRLLRVLASDPGRVFSKAELMREVWGYEPMTRSRTLDSHACRLRRRLHEAGGQSVVALWGAAARTLAGCSAHRPVGERCW